MSTQKTVPVYIVELHTLNGDKLAIPLTSTEIVRHGNDCRALAGAMQKAMQKDLAAKGEYDRLLRMRNDWPLTQARVQCSLDNPIAAEHGGYRQTFDVFYRQLPDQTWIAYIPALAIEAGCREEAGLTKTITAHVQAEYSRRMRFGDIQQILSTQWYTEAQVHPHQLAVNFYSPKEIEHLHRGKRQSLLPAVARQFSVYHQQSFDMNEELREMDMALGGRYPRSVLIIGEEGRGKTALFNEYARTKKYRTENLWHTSASRLVRGLTGDTGWQQALALLLLELRETKPVLYVGHVLELFEVGQYEGNDVSVGQAMKDALQRGELTLVAEATEQGLAALQLRAPGFAELFTFVRMRHKDLYAMESIVTHAVAQLAARHKTELERAAVEEILALQRRYTPYSGMPGKTIRFFESMILLHKHVSGRISRRQAIAQFCAETGIADFMLDGELPLDHDKTLRFFQSCLFGQQHACAVVSEILSAVKTSLLRGGKPIASLLFVGPTGVGKTEMAKTLAQFMFGSRQRMIRFDMSEYSDQASVLRLTGEWGSPEASLVARIRQQAFSVVLLDEVEKAHHSFYDLLLQILGDGRLTDARGRLANFCSAIVIMTSNIGAEEFQRASMGFHEQHQTGKQSGDHFTHAVQQFFRPELINRLDQIVPFFPLEKSIVHDIVNREVDRIRTCQGLSTGKIPLQVDEQVTIRLADENHDPRYGARQLQRVLRRRLLVPIAKSINATAPKNYATLHAQIMDDHVAVAMQGNRIDTAAQDRHANVLLNTASLRRALFTVFEGRLYNAVQSERQTLERRTKEPAFWRQSAKTLRLKALRDINKQCTKLEENILQMEGDGVAALLGCADHQTVAGLEAWHACYFSLLRDLYSLAVDPENACTIAIYGGLPVLDQVKTFYSEVVALAGYELQLYAVLPRQPKPSDDKHDTVERTSADANQDTDDAAQADKKPDLFEHHPVPLPKGMPHGNKIGYLLRLRGPACMRFFCDESGVQEWAVNTKVNKLYIHVSNTAVEKLKHPPNVHRRHFFDNRQTRRNVDRKSMSDKPMQFSGTANPTELHGQLVQRFYRSLEELLSNR